MKTDERRWYSRGSNLKMKMKMKNRGSKLNLKYEKETKKIMELSQLKRERGGLQGSWWDCGRKNEFGSVDRGGFVGWR
ncbi:hypothetical protein L1887_22824 [Cichorium endivia]|nr:hypothetical protein L1887_22824 [Cichorium endivia]